MSTTFLIGNGFNVRLWLKTEFSDLYDTYIEQNRNTFYARRMNMEKTKLPKEPTDEKGKEFLKNFIISISLFVVSAVVAYTPVLVNAIIEHSSQGTNNSDFIVIFQETLYSSDFRYISVSLMILLALERNLIVSKKFLLFDVLEGIWSLAVLAIWLFLLNDKICSMFESWGVDIVLFDCICLAITLLLGIMLLITKCRE